MSGGGPAPQPQKRARPWAWRGIMSAERRIIGIGEGPHMECPACGQRAPFDLQFTYHQLRFGPVGCAVGVRWLFQCRACHEAWRVKRTLVDELERGGIPITFLERDGLLMVLLLLTLILLCLRG